MSRVAALVLGVCLVGGCTKPHTHTEERAPTVAVTGASEPIDAGLAPLDGVPWLLELREGKDNLGVVSVPLGARERRPVMIALHGGSDRPEWACGEWRGVTGGYPILVCPRGQGPATGLSWSTPALTKRAIDRALEATRKTLGGYMADAPITLAGFSMGATQAAFLAREDPRRFPRVVIAENAYDPASGQAFAAHFAGERVLLSCTTGGCEPTYRRFGAVLANRGVPVRLNQSGSGAHGIWDDVVRSLRRDWPWLVEGARGWEGYAAAVDDAPSPGKTTGFDAGR